MVQFKVDVVVDPSKAVGGIRQVDRSVDQLQNKTSALGRTLRRAFAIVGTALAVRQVISLTDSYTELQNRLRTIITDQQELNSTLESLTRIANNTRQQVGSVVELYQRGSIAAKELGASSEELLLFVDRVGKGLAVQGGAASESAGALRQLSQALGSGIVRAEEFNSILEGAFPIAQAAAKGIDRAGGSVARLRQLIVKGQITSREFFTGFLKGSEELEEQFGRTTPTIGQAFTVLTNSLATFLGKANEAFGITDKLSNAIIGLANVFITLSNTVGTIAERFGSTFTAIGDTITGFFTSAVTNAAAFVDFFVGLFNGLGNVLGTVFDALAEQPKNVFDVMKKAARDAVEFVIDVFLAMLQTIGDVIRKTIDLLGVIVDASIDSLAALAARDLQGAQIAADNATGAIKRIAQNITEIPDVFKSSLGRLQGVEFLPTVQVSQEAADLGANIASEFKRGFEENQPAQGLVNSLLFGPSGGPEGEGEDPLAKVKKSIQDVGETGEIVGTKLVDGFKTAFNNIQKEAADLASVGENIVNSFADNATDALVKFAETGRFAFKDFARSIVSDLTRIAARLLVVQAISAAIGIFGGGAAVGPAAGAGASLVGGALGGFGGGRASGGPVQPNRSYLVGENGPEILQLGNQGGFVTPNAAAMQPVAPNIQVVTVASEDEIPQAISSGRADEVILNVLARNSDRVKQVVS